VRKKFEDLLTKTLDARAEKLTEREAQELGQLVGRLQKSEECVRTGWVCSAITALEALALRAVDGEFNCVATVAFGAAVAATCFALVHREVRLKDTTRWLKTRSL